MSRGFTASFRYSNFASYKDLARGATLVYCPSRLSILLATFTPLRPLTYFETPR